MRPEDRIRVRHMIEAAESAALFLSGRNRDDLETSKASSYFKRLGRTRCR